MSAPEFVSCPDCTGAGWIEYCRGCDLEQRDCECGYDLREGVRLLCESCGGDGENRCDGCGQRSTACECQTDREPGPPCGESGS